MNSYPHVLDQLKEVLDQMTSDEYRKPLPIFNGSSVGKHVRHILEFFQCLSEANENKLVNYDARKRNPDIESNLSTAICTIIEIKEKFETIDFEQELILVSKMANREYRVTTNFLRELVYVFEHAIHHYALIRIGIEQNFPEIHIHPHFGVAFSTIEFQENVCIDVYS